MTNDAPFLLHQQLNLDMLDHAQAVETLRNSTLQEQVISVLETIEKRPAHPQKGYQGQNSGNGSRGIEENAESTPTRLSIPLSRVHGSLHHQTRRPH